MNSEPPLRILLVDDEEYWLKALRTVVEGAVCAEVTCIDSYEEAAALIETEAVFSFSLAIIDVRLREPIFDQGGLGLVDTLRHRTSSVPVLLLTAYEEDYPNIRAITDRYPQVLIHGKNHFMRNVEATLAALLAQLPARTAPRAPSPRIEIPLHESTKPVGEARVLGFALGVVALVLGACLGLFWILEQYAPTPTIANIFSGIIALALLGTLAHVYGKETLAQAWEILRCLLRMARPKFLRPKQRNLC